MQHLTMLGVVCQQCCVRLHGALEIENVGSTFPMGFTILATRCCNRRQETVSVPKCSLK